MFELSKKYLKTQYNIISLDTCVDWILINENISYKTKNRLLNICWKDYIIDSSYININIINFYIYFNNKYWFTNKKISYTLMNDFLTNFYNDNKNKWHLIEFYNEKIKSYIENKL